ncbi:MAG: hypothetical protein COT28_21775 [Methylobacterium sp. CG08_land_8_20_14_0_20_71_15]|nr:MAG: hypothetical protein COT56_09565 [Methylobacterium sp. CG09_land_8_20_14_0_10_71_15]PIU11114.1 MAG: hypothetical protein COT28_21775 [Methylobacterium sp. CG08_land_8_20_14_0_20_71_15]
MIPHALPLVGSSASDAVRPLAVDHWLVSSLLQKAIRRGDADLAARAALTLLDLRGSTIWRRFMVIAFEDVGAGCVEALADVVAFGTDKDLRAKAGSDAQVAVWLARRLALATKDRSSDYLICSARNHPSLEEARETIGSRTVADRIGMVMDESVPLPVRATAAWYASGIEWTGEKRVGRGDLSGLINAFRLLGVPDRLAAVTRTAALRTREPITLMVPLIWLSAFGGEHPSVRETHTAPSPMLGEIPAYAFDKHTRIGKRAITLLSRENEAVRTCLEHHVPEFRHRQTAWVAAFYADATPITRRLTWDQSEALEALGMENDLMREGVPQAGVVPLVDAIRANLDHLNEIRGRLYAASMAGGETR